MKDNVLIDVKNLKKYFYKDTGIISKKMQEIKAVDDVSFYIKKGETLGLVGESGCGKTTAGRTIMRLYEPTGGQILYNETDIAKLSQKDFMPYRKKIQMIFQDPYASLDPRMTVADIIGEPLDIHHLASGKERQERIFELLDKVGLGKNHANRYPHEFSGGQRQRIGIARAVATNPSFIIADEPVSALDVSIQAQVLNLMMDLRDELKLSYLFIAHDLSVVRHVTERLGIMYLGFIVETGERDAIFDAPKHPYTQALLSAAPTLDQSRLCEPLQGDVPSPINLPAGCPFANRCPKKIKECDTTRPRLAETDGRLVACHLYGR
ncbi:MAG: dipeptide ABC transporter ATP-binding protein [Cloacibacillus sp.]